MDEGTLVKATSGCISSRLGAETVILETERGTYFELDEVGSRIWELLQNPRAVDEIAAAVGAEFDVDEDRCREDVERLLAELHSRGLVTTIAG